MVIFLTSASKVSVELNGGFFDVSPENDRASPNVNTPSAAERLYSHVVCALSVVSMTLFCASLLVFSQYSRGMFLVLVSEADSSRISSGEGPPGLTQILPKCSCKNQNCVRTTIEGVGAGGTALVLPLYKRVLHSCSVIKRNSNKTNLVIFVCDYVCPSSFNLTHKTASDTNGVPGLRGVWDAEGGFI